MVRASEKTGTLGANRSVELAGKVISCVLFISPPVLAWFGFQQGSDVERGANAKARQQIVTIEECKDYGLDNEGRKIVLPEVPNSIKQACGLPNEVSLGSTALKVDPEDIVVELPSADELNGKVASLEADANDFNRTTPLIHTVFMGGVGCGLALWRYFDRQSV